jgi:hypothetical protein
MEVDVIALFEPECGAHEIELVSAVLQSDPMGLWPHGRSFRTRLRRLGRAQTRGGSEQWHAGYLDCLARFGHWPR